MKFSFEGEVAKDVGISAAIVLNHIEYWCAKNSVAGINHHDGRYWMFDSQATVAEALPFLSLMTVRRAIETLVDKGYILTGNYNRHRYDKTKWYALSDKSLCIYAESAKASAQNQPTPLVQNEPLPKAVELPPEPAPKKTKKAKPKSSATFDPTLFEKFWQAYPRKDEKVKARKAWEKLKVSLALYEEIMDGLRRAIQFDHRFRDKTYTPYPATWLNGNSWQNEYEMPKPASPPPINDPFEELKRIAADPGDPPPELPPELQWR